MENESKNTVIRYHDSSSNQSWRVDKEIQFNTEKKSIPKLIKYKNSLRSVCFDPTGTKIIAFPWHADCFACMWDRDGKKLENLDFDAYDKLSEDNSEWSDKFLSSGNSYSFPFYEGNDIELLQKEFDCWYPTVCCNEEQTYVVPQFRVYGGHDVYAWNPVEQKRLFTLQHQGPVQSVDFNPQGIEIITASFDGTVRLWNKKDGKELLCIKYSTRVMSASFNATGTEIVVATDDGKIQILVKETFQ
jgi:WD40 repeat protein